MRTRTTDWRAIGLLGAGVGAVWVAALASAAPARPPVVAAQVTRGAAVYARTCQGCHGDALQGRRAPTLRGPAWVARYTGGTRTLGDLHAKVSKTMPRNAPGTLGTAQALDVVAFLFDRSGVPLPAAGVTAATLRTRATAPGPVPRTSATQTSTSPNSAPTPRAAQVKSGAAVYAASCQGCHGPALQGGAGPALTGAAFLASHATVRAVHTTVSTLMPMTAPGTLSAAQAIDVVAFLLDRNGVGGGPAALTAADLDRPLR